MRFKTYVNKLRSDQKKVLAKKLKISGSYLNGVARGTVRPSPRLVIRIENLTGVSKKSLLPDVF